MFPKQLLPSLQIFLLFLEPLIPRLKKSGHTTNKYDKKTHDFNCFKKNLKLDVLQSSIE